MARSIANFVRSGSWPNYSTTGPPNPYSSLSADAGAPVYAFQGATPGSLDAYAFRQHLDAKGDDDRNPPLQWQALGPLSGSGSGTSTTPTPVTPINPPPQPDPVVIDAPDYGDSGAQDYIAGTHVAPGGDVSSNPNQTNAFENVYNTIAPALWDQYQRSVESPLINRFAGSGTLGSAVGGLSGAAADALQNSRMQAGNAIASQAYTAAQAPLLQQMTGDQQAAQSQYQGALSALLSQYAAQSNAASQEALQPYQATVSQLEYPYQIFSGLLGGSMPQTVVTGGGGGKK